MITIFVIISILLFVSAISKAIQDTLQFHFETSIFSKAKGNWWNPKTSWKNKNELLISK